MLYVNPAGSFADEVDKLEEKLKDEETTQYRYFSRGEVDRTTTKRWLEKRSSLSWMSLR